MLKVCDKADYGRVKIVDYTYNMNITMSLKNAFLIYSCSVIVLIFALRSCLPSILIQGMYIHVSRESQERK